MRDLPRRHLLLDAMGVIYQAADDVAELLVPFVLQHKPSCDRAKIEATYLSASLGELSADALWVELGIEPVQEQHYLDGHRLTAGVHGFLDWADAQQLPVSCLSNDVGRWSQRLRESHGLAARFVHWVISGEVGSRKPSPAIYEDFIFRSGARPAQTLFADDRPKNVLAAAELGFQAVLFGPQIDRIPPGILHAADFPALQALALEWVVRPEPRS